MRIWSGPRAVRLGLRRIQQSFSIYFVVVCLVPFVLLALRHRQPEERARQGGVSPAGAVGRRGDRELPAGRDGAPRPRLRHLAASAAGPRLLRHLGLRAGRAAQGQSGLRPDRAGPVGRHERDRRCRERAAAGRLSGRRHHRGPDGGVRDRGRAGAARAHRGGRVHRRVDAGGDARHHGLAGLQLADRRGSSAAARQRKHDGGAVRAVRHRRRPAQHRRQPAAAVRDA